MSNQGRVPAGVPTGGQFAAATHAESTVDLFGEQAPMPQPRPEPTGLDWAAIDHSWNNLRDVDMANGDARGARFSHADLRGARMTGIVADGADFTKANLAGADISGGSFRDAQFTDATISGRLDETDLSGANLMDAEIGDATGADFSGACLARASLHGVFQNCDFRGADLRGTRMNHGYHSGKNKAMFIDCQFDDEPWDGEGYPNAAEWPEGFDPRLNAAFRREGFDADDQARWQEYAGVDDPTVARAYANEGFDPEHQDTGRWVASFAGDAGSANAFRQAGFEPETASDWHGAYIPPEQAVDWHARGFRVATDATPYDDASAWHQCGFSPSEADPWSRRNFTVAEAVDAQRQGHTADTAPQEMARRKTLIESERERLAHTSVTMLRTHRNIVEANPDSQTVGTDAEAKLRAVELLLREKSKRGR